MKRRFVARGFTLLELLAATAIFATLLILTGLAVQRLSQNQRLSQARREVRQEADACFAQITQDFENMPIRRDIEYGFGRRINYPGEVDAVCAFLTEVSAPPSLNARPAATGPQRGFSIVAYRVGVDQNGSWAGLERGLAGLTRDDYFLGLRKPADIDWPQPVIGADALPSLPSFPADESPRHWPPARLDAWPLGRRHFAPLSPYVVGIGLAYQLRRDAVATAGSPPYPAGSILALPPSRERPPGSGDWFTAAEDIGAIVVGLALLPESARRRLTQVELTGLRDALAYNPSLAGGPNMTETPLEYWTRRAGMFATDPHPQIPEWVRQELRFQQRLMQVGPAGY